MNKVYTYELDENGDSVMFHDKTGYWFAYARSVFKDEVYRGKGKTKAEAVQDSIATSEKYT